MRTLHLYLLRQVLASLLLTVLVFTLVLLLGSVLKDIVPLLRLATVGIVAEAVGLLIPYVWAFALPMGMLTATLLIFGRFSADQELTAARAGGISLLSLISPILLLSLALCALSALINMEVAPRFRVAFTTLRFKLQMEFSNFQLPEGRPIKDFPGYIFYAGKNRRGMLEDVNVFALKDQTNVVKTIIAPRGKLDANPVTKQLSLTLYDAKVLTMNAGKSVPGVFGELQIQFDPPRTRQGAPRIDDISFTQLCNELRELEERISFPPSIPHLSAEQLKAAKDELQKQRKDLVAPVLFQIHRQVAFSFACFGFTLLGIPLGIRVHRRETNVGVAIALLLVALYYSFVLLAQALETHPQWAPHLMVWLPNFVFQAVGAVLLWRANRGT